MFEDVNRATLETRFGQLEIAQVSTRPGESGGPTVDADDVVAAALADAKSEAAERLGIRYNLPVSGDTPPTLVRIISNLARFWLHREQASGEIRKRYKASLADLDAIAAGALQIAGTNAELAAWLAADRNVPLTTPSTVAHSPGNRVFTDRTLAGF